VAYVYGCLFLDGRDMAGSDLFTGSLDLIILKSLSWGPMHGYAIGQWIRTSTREGLTVKEGALYPALHRLQAKGFLDEEWGHTETNREAKFYRLTPTGRKQLASEMARWRDYSRVMTAALAASR
jgi:PadR family transcriptional regulator, regulatory protein PadR